MKAWGRLFAAAAVLVALAVAAASASASSEAHPRHVEFRPPTSHAFLFLGERDGYEFALSFTEPDYAILEAVAFDPETQAGVSTTYGAHFQGSLVGGQVRARFGAIGSIALRFIPDGKVRPGRRGKNCEGRSPREESGRFVGRISLRGEGDYFRFSARHVAGSISRTFRVRCRVKHQAPVPAAPSLLEEVVPVSGFLVSSNGGALTLLGAGVREGSRRLELRASHMAGAPAGAEVSVRAFEYQGRMPVGRGAWASESPAGTLLTSLPGEHPPTATLKPGSPFVGEATYLASSPTSHSWTGDLAVQFPGLLEPLAGPDFISSLCVVSPLKVRYGCDFLPPDWQMAE
ncbi:MAG TPA: hypothetical protein VJL81_07745 [Solirubrobacterales bacterium]|nr:hypothetical protein [Solirubrobacterales bacterium]